jgi:hypothetical protein
MTPEQAKELMDAPRSVLKLLYAHHSSGKKFATYAGLSIAMGNTDKLYRYTQRICQQAEDLGFIGIVRAEGQGRGKKSVVYLTEKGYRMISLLQGKTNGP